MTDRQFNLIVRENLRAAAEHIRRGHAGRWRDCRELLCRDAQHFVPPIEAVSLQAPRSATPGPLVQLVRFEAGDAAPN